MRNFFKKLTTLLASHGPLILLKRVGVKGKKVFSTPYWIAKLKWSINKQNKSLDEWVDFVVTDKSQQIFSLQDKWEIRSLLEKAESIKPKRIAEIGTCMGGTLFLFSRVAQADAHLISVDLPYGPFGGGYGPWRIPLYKAFARNNQKIDLIRGNSRSAGIIERFDALLGDNLLDLLFIDGDHTYEGVKADFEIYKKYVRSGGLIVFHDIATPERVIDIDIYNNQQQRPPEVEKFWKEVKQDYDHEEFIVDGSVLGIGALVNP